jgi:hypothetical protein
VKYCFLKITNTWNNLKSKFTSFWDVAQCNFINRLQCFGRALCLHLQVEHSRLRLEVSPKCLYLSTSLHGVIHLEDRDFKIHCRRDFQTNVRYSWDRQSWSWYGDPTYFGLFVAYAFETAMVQYDLKYKSISQTSVHKSAGSLTVCFISFYITNLPSFLPITFCHRGLDRKAIREKEWKPSPSRVIRGRGL